jgi:hypothetical protein
MFGCDLAAMGVGGGCGHDHGSKHDIQNAKSEKRFEEAK